jgi:hypothetical protein
VRLQNTVHPAAHIEGCTATGIQTGSGSPARRRGGVSQHAAEIRAAKADEYRQRLWNRENDDLDLLIHNRRDDELKIERVTQKASKMADLLPCIWRIRSGVTHVSTQRPREDLGTKWVAPSAPEPLSFR